MADQSDWNSNYRIHDDNIRWFKNCISQEEKQVKRGSLSYLFSDPHECYGRAWNPLTPSRAQIVPSIAEVVDLMPNPEYPSSELHSHIPPETEEMVAMDNSQVDSAYVDDISSEPCFPPALGQLLLGSSQQLESSCQDLNLASLSDNDTVRFCNFLNGLKIPLPASLGTILVKYGIYSKVTSLQELMSRSLSAAVMELAKNYPQVVVEGILVPSIQNDEIGLYQKDVLRKIIQMIPGQYVSFTLQKVLENLPPKENLLPFIQDLIDRKAELDEDTINQFVAKIQAISVHFQKNVAFGKILRDIILTFQGQLTQVQLLIMKEVVDGHKSILAKNASMLIQKQM